jgi:lipoate-protein ligase A
VSGNAQVVRGAVVLQHGTLLLAVDPELMYTVLRAPEGVPPQRVVASVRAKVAGIVDTFPHSNVGTLVPQLCSSLAEAFGETLGLEPVMGNLTPEEQGLVQHLSNKYRSPEWLARIP